MNISAGLKVGAAVLVVLLIGFGAGVYIDQAYPDQLPYLAKHSVGKVDTTELQQALKVIQANYVDSNLDSSKLSSGTVRGLVESLGDPFSSYLSPTEWKNLQDSYNSRYAGIGIYLRFSTDYPLITGTIKNSPADKAGLKAGDRIVMVGSKDMRAATSEQSTAAIQGPVGSSVTLTVDRFGTSLTFTIKRAEIVIPSVESAVIGDHVLYVRIFSFSAEVPSEFAAALSGRVSGAKGIVLDLRDDGGGFITAADDVISEFVVSGETVELRDRTNNVERHTVQDTHSENGTQITEHLATSIPLVVLVNANSASASEIVSGSLQVHKRATLVGVKTFGKGSVQQDFVLGDGADLHLTIKRWYLPDGKTINHVGLQPDVTVAMPTDGTMYDAREPSSDYTADPQLTAALKALPGG